MTAQTEDTTTQKKEAQWLFQNNCAGRISGYVKLCKDN